MELLAVLSMRHGMTVASLARLCRQGKVVAEKRRVVVGDQVKLAWYVDEDSLIVYGVGRRGGRDKGADMLSQGLYWAVDRAGLVCLECEVPYGCDDLHEWCVFRRS